MLIVSLHGISIFAKKGLYPEELINGNQFEVDVDVHLAEVSYDEFVDYTIIRQIVFETFDHSGHTLEILAKDIQKGVKLQWSFAEKIRVAIRKLNPPMPGKIAYAQIVIE